jgi:hypothetical protein
MFNRSPPSIAAQQVSSVEFPGMQANVFCALLTTGALAFAAGPAIGQDAPRADATNAILVPDTTLTPEESALLGNALVFDPSVQRHQKNHCASRPTKVTPSHAQTRPMAQVRLL